MKTLLLFIALLLTPSPTLTGRWQTVWLDFNPGSNTGVMDIRENDGILTIKCVYAAAAIDMKGTISFDNQIVAGGVQGNSYFSFSAITDSLKTQLTGTIIDYDNTTKSLVEKERYRISAYKLHN